MMGNRTSSGERAELESGNLSLEEAAGSHGVEVDTFGVDLCLELPGSPHGIIPRNSMSVRSESWRGGLAPILTCRTEAP